MVQFANCHNHSLFSDGVYTPLQLAELAKKEENRGKNIVVLLPDTGERYLSTELFN